MASHDTTVVVPTNFVFFTMSAIFSGKWFINSNNFAHLAERKLKVSKNIKNEKISSPASQ